MNSMILESISPYIISFAIAWLVAHTIKFAISLYKKEQYTFISRLFMSGGMPSSHSATTVALATIIGLVDGYGSGLFAVAALFSIIVMYDALKVRRSSGEQGIALRQLIKEQKSEVKLPRVALGHTPAEVLVGASIGVVVAIVVFLSTI